MSSGNSVVRFAIDYWWVVLIAISVLGSMIRGVRDFFLETYERVVEIRSRHQAQGLPEQQKLEKKPGPCVHRNVVRIMSMDDELVGWLCKTCDERLPKNWAVREEDL